MGSSRQLSSSGHPLWEPAWFLNSFQPKPLKLVTLPKTMLALVEAHLMRSGAACSVHMYMHIQAFLTYVAE